ncbi:peptidase S8/S53 domain-containing protein [Lactarius quietus]|nr:peptidase S8/S53 domain-containing protein [Lactarius quietus]
MLYYRLYVLSVLATASLAAPLVPRWDDIRVKHTWHAVPSNWECLGPPSSNTTIDLHIALLPQSENALIDALYEVSTPSHPKYGAHLSKEQVAQLVAPHRDTLDLVNSWLKYHGIPRSSISVSHGGGWLTVAVVPVSQANEMLGASYQLYRQSGTNDTSILRTISYALPAELHKHVRTVVPTTYFASTRTPRQSSRRRSVNATTDMASRMLGTMLSSHVNPKEVTPTDLRWLYKTSAYVPAATKRIRWGCRTGQWRRVPPEPPTVEGSQNIQYAEAMAYPTPVTFYSVGGDIVVTAGTKKPGRGDSTLEWLHHVLDQEDVPKTISTSYGEYEKDLPPEYATAICDMYAQLGARGVSALFPSGNEGVGKGACRPADGDGVRFIPEFPASCPYVTIVGGTTGGMGETDQGLEVAAKLSGGGFSNYFARPPYQDEAVPEFLQQLGGHPGGRGIPDISAQSLNFLYIIHNELSKAGGTSFATPVHSLTLRSALGTQLITNGQTAAGIISLLNDYLLSTDRSPLGFLNPLLYGPLRLAMNDITYGSNPGCNTPGFDAIPGWDPVTGLGTPDFLKLQALRNLIFQE